MTRLSAATITSTALLRPVDAKLNLGTESSLLQSNLNPCLYIPAPRRTATSPSGLESPESSAEHAPEYPAEDVIAEAHVPEYAAEVCPPEDVFLSVVSADACVAESVILGFLLFIAENRVGFAYLLEFLLGIRLLVSVSSSRNIYLTGMKGFR